HAGRLALERADDQLPAAQEIEAGPTHLRQRIKNERRGVGGVGNAIGLPLEESLKLSRQQLVGGPLVGEVVALARVSHFLPPQARSMGKGRTASMHCAAAASISVRSKPSATPQQ